MTVRRPRTMLTPSKGEELHDECGRSRTCRPRGPFRECYEVSERMPETEAVSIAVFDVKVPAPVRLITDIPHDLYAFRLELGMQRIGIIDPDVRVPRPAFEIDDVIGAHLSRRVELHQHNDDDATLYHPKRRREWRPAARQQGESDRTSRDRAREIAGPATRYPRTSRLSVIAA